MTTMSYARRRARQEQKATSSRKTCLSCDRCWRSQPKGQSVVQPTKNHRRTPVHLDKSLFGAASCLKELYHAKADSFSFHTISNYFRPLFHSKVAGFCL